jgi:hypothetical protein
MGYIVSGLARFKQTVRPRHEAREGLALRGNTVTPAGENRFRRVNAKGQIAGLARL